MLHAQMLSAVGLIRPSRRRGFCPACRLFQTGDAPQEIAAPALLALAFLVVAALAWVVTIVRMSSMDDMAMGLGSFDAFVASWAVMMAAMMFPSALPVVFEFAQHAERRRGWQAATAVLGVTYLGIWLAFGIGCYVVYNALGMPWPNQGLIGGAALVIAGLYGLTPLKRASEAWCRERCALHSPLPFNNKAGRGGPTTTQSCHIRLKACWGLFTKASKVRVGCRCGRYPQSGLAFFT